MRRAAGIAPRTWRRRPDATAQVRRGSLMSAGGGRWLAYFLSRWPVGGPGSTSFRIGLGIGMATFPLLQPGSILDRIHVSHLMVGDPGQSRGQIRAEPG